MTDEQQGIPENAIVLTRRAWVDPGDLEVTFSRSSGPGGQHVNKVSTRTTIRVAVGAIEGLDDGARRRLRDLAGSRLTQDDVIIINADSTRSQKRNREEAFERLADLVRRAMIRPLTRRATKPSRAMIERRITAKKQQGEKKRRRQGRDW
jgi:ribosome-associated protein